MCLPLALTAAATATHTVIQNNIFGSGQSDLVISNKEVSDIMKKVKSLEDSRLLIKRCH